MKTTKTRRIKELNFRMIEFNKGVDKGFKLKREPTLQECRHILKNIMCICINTRKDLDDYEEYQDYNIQLKKDVSDWLRGDCDDSYIMEYAYDCSEDDIGIWTAFKIAEYLQSKEII